MFIHLLFYCGGSRREAIRSDAFPFLTMSIIPKATAFRERLLGVVVARGTTSDLCKVNAMGGARPLAAPSGFALRAQATRRLSARANDAQPRKCGASDARLTPLETPRRRHGLKVAVVQSALTGTALTRRPSPVVAASSRPSVCVRCPRHENLPTQDTK